MRFMGAAGWTSEQVALAGEIGEVPRETAIRQERRGTFQRSYPRASEVWRPCPSLKSGEARRDSLWSFGGPNKASALFCESPLLRWKISQDNKDVCVRAPGDPK